MASQTYAQPSAEAANLIVPQQCQNKTLDFQQNLDCAQKYFVIDSQPINPMIIKDLVPWISDSGDQVVAISLLDSQKSNKYFCAHLTTEREGKYFSVKNTSEEGFFLYTLEGITNNGVFVLKTTESGGGSGVFSDLLFIRIKEDVGFGDLTKDKLTLNHKRILIEKLGAIPLGDRVSASITVQGNSVILKTEQAIPPHEQTTQKIMLEVEKKGYKEKQ